MISRFQSLIFCLMAVFAFIGCDKIEHPVLENPNDAIQGDNGIVWSFFPELDSTSYVIPIFPAMTSTLKDVLLEDYTGHKCNNCPPAATIAKGLEQSNPGRVHVVSVHAGPDGGFQQTDSEHPTDFTTEAGTLYAVFPTPAIFGNPAGTVNRVDGSSQGGGIWQFSTDWANLTATELLLPARANLDLAYYHSEATNSLLVHAAIESEDMFSPADYRFIIFLVRQVVEAPQTMPNGSINEEYEHHNVLSDNINGTWGTAIQLDTLSTEEQLLFNFSFELPDPLSEPTYSKDNLALIGFVMDRTSQRVYQSTLIEIE